MAILWRLTCGVTCYMFGFAQDANPTVAAFAQASFNPKRDTVSAEDGWMFRNRCNMVVWWIALLNTSDNVLIQIPPESFLCDRYFISMFSACISEFLWELPLPPTVQKLVSQVD